MRFIKKSKPREEFVFRKGTFDKITALQIIIPASPNSESADLVVNRIKLQGSEVLFFLFLHYGNVDIYYHREIAECLNIAFELETTTMSDTEYEAFKKR